MFHNRRQEPKLAQKSWIWWCKQYQLPNLNRQNIKCLKKLWLLHKENQELKVPECNKPMTTISSMASDSKTLHAKKLPHLSQSTKMDPTAVDAPWKEDTHWWDIAGTPLVSPEWPWKEIMDMIIEWRDALDMMYMVEATTATIPWWGGTMAEEGMVWITIWVTASALPKGMVIEMKDWVVDWTVPSMHCPEEVMVVKFLLVEIL